MNGETVPVRRRFGQSAVRTPANLLTLGRLLFAIPVLVLIHRDGAGWLTVVGWFVLAVTDSVDGWLARRDGTTRSGAFLDPLVDKVLVLGGFTVLALRGELPWVAVAIVAVREVGVSVYRSVAARRGVSLPARRLGKVKTFLQFLAVGIVVLPWTADTASLHAVVVWVAVAFTVVSGIDIVASSRRAEP